jgi:hypothetical protein
MERKVNGENRVIWMKTELSGVELKKKQRIIYKE